MGKSVNTGRIIRSVSLTPEDDALITELSLSKSGILRQKIEEIRQHSHNFQNMILDKDRKIQNLIKEVQELYDKLDKLGGKE